MVESIEVGPGPCDEESADIGKADFPERNRAECKAFINLIKRVLGEPPEGALLYTKSNHGHDYGTYREVAVKITATNPDVREAAYEYAYRCEGNSPTAWDDEARAELAQAGFPVSVEA
ncbi:hypothetical protein AWB69_08929 [Caballeronia udeis]|uniref:Uncharacterized protein n=1 Tax=Caballeronia udeis TaxID=1232866 RepID=A0A158JWQ0_9BURK|nr:hypothetical protein [Caballeronia udeis]SAL73145.1 hypothetical protein AWB69_08929 [Caballeronia udeis]